MKGKHVMVSRTLLFFEEWVMSTTTVVHKMFLTKKHKSKYLLNDGISLDFKRTIKVLPKNVNLANNLTILFLRKNVNGY